MIPHRLRLQNFMCYRDEQSLDFSGLHLACLSGENGHGKSALLDAITWALWGRARADRDDELIALGATEMWVEFEFTLAGQRYRVWRQRSKRGRGQSDLHFYVWNSSHLSRSKGEEAGKDSSGDWQLLDEGGLRERQAQIIRTLRMEYETFINSSFLLQGKADSFTVKTAAERKQILADILGLERFDRYEERAKQEAQARREEVARLEGDIRSMDAELSRRAEYENQLQTARAAAAIAAQALRTAEAERAAAQSALNQRQAEARQLADLRQRLGRSERDLTDLRNQLGGARARVAQFEAVLAQQEEIEAGWAALQAARQEDAAWNARLLRHSQLREALNRAQAAVEQARLALTAARDRLGDRIADLDRRIAAGQEQNRILTEVQAVLARMAEWQARREQVAVELRELTEQMATLKTESDRLKAEGTAIREKIEMITATEAANCPLCGQALAEDHRNRMLAEFVAERDGLAGRWQACHAELKKLAARKAALEAEDTELARELRPRDARQRQAAQAEAAIAEAQAAAEERARLSQEQAALTDRLAAGDYAAAERSELARIQAELDRLGYDPGHHEQIRATVGRLEPFDARYSRQLLPALEGIGEARERVDALAAQLNRREAELADDRREAERLAAAVADLPALQAALQRADVAVERAAEAERRARLAEGAAMQQLGALAALEERRQQRTAQLERLTAEVSIYNQLREAFGKKGLQAMIIENAIPEVEVEANRLLGRMTDGRMSLRLETQREKVTGGVAETLDIIIADELGARAYEMYSGGEAFRANLALRIAISKLLARRAGAQLQTLVIDEGFGSQDAQGRALVVEAINSIREDFARIIVVTHIEELKDLFPARIDVVKTPTGSRISIA